MSFETCTNSAEETTAMNRSIAAGLVAGLALPLPLTAAEARFGGFSEPELWLDDLAHDTGWRVDRHLRLTGDVDGDGLADLVGFGEQGVVVALSTGSRFSEPETWVDNYSYSNGWRSDQHPRLLADLDDDGLLDIIGFGNTGVFVSLSTGAGFHPPHLWVDAYTVTRGWRVDQHPRALADVDGDGRLDVVGFGDDGVYVSLSTGAGFREPARWLDDLGHGHGWQVERNPRTLVDVNGDGRADILGFGDRGVLVALAAGDRFTRPERVVDEFGYDQGWRPERHIRQLADVDGDGRHDIIGFGDRGPVLVRARPGGFTEPWHVLLEFGHAQGWRRDRHPRLVLDIDGDDLADLLGFSDRGVVIARSNGEGFARPYHALNEFGYSQGWRLDRHVRAVADVDGDGRLDIIGFGDQGVLVALAAH
jgi:hypothetical protein